MSDSVKRLLLAGSDGIIGSFLFDELLGEYEIAPIGIVDRDQKNFKSIDLRDQEATRNYICHNKKYEAIIFLVGLAHFKGEKNDIDEFKNVNFRTLVNLLTIADECHVSFEKVIFASTISVYGEEFSTVYYDENGARNGTSPYAKTKIMCEDFLIEKYKQKSWILRFAPVFGQQFKLNIDRRTKLVKHYYRVGDGKQQLSLLNIGNIAIAVMAILRNKVPPDIYNLADPSVYSYNDLLEWQDARRIIVIPQFLVRSIHYMGQFIKSNYLRENAIKLLSNNVYPTQKIEQYVQLISGLDRYE